MPENVAFRSIQSLFAAHLKDPEGCPPPPGVAVDRMAVYRELFFNNIESFMAGGFPVLKSILEGPRWMALVRDFYRDHTSKTPLFIGIGAEFVAYLTHERPVQDQDPPFLSELAHYEWVELELQVSESEAPECREASFLDLDHCRPYLSPLARVLSYAFPVHRIGPEQAQISSKGDPVRLLVYRGLDEDVHFVELNEATFELLQGLEDSGDSLKRQLEHLARRMAHPSPENVVAYGRDLLLDLHRKGAIGV